MLEVGTQLDAPVELAAEHGQLRAPRRRRTGGRSRVHSMPAAHRWASAVR